MSTITFFGDDGEIKRIKVFEGIVKGRKYRGLFMPYVKMPTCCVDCAFFSTEINACRYLGDEYNRRHVADDFDFTQKRLYDCPLVDLGRISDTIDLGDKDEPQRGYCQDCRYIKITGAYGECSKGYLGMVNPRDYCSRFLRDDGQRGGVIIEDIGLLVQKEEK